MLPKLDEFPHPKEKNYLLVFDDFMTGDNHQELTDYFSRGRHCGISIIYITQNLFHENLRALRNQAEYIAFFGTPTGTTLTNYAREFGNGLNTIAMKEYFDLVAQTNASVNEKRPFLIKTTPDNNKYRFYCGFDPIIKGYEVAGDDDTDVTEKMKTLSITIQPPSPSIPSPPAAVAVNSKQPPIPTLAPQAVEENVPALPDVDEMIVDELATTPPLPDRPPRDWFKPPTTTPTSDGNASHRKTQSPTKLNKKLQFDDDADYHIPENAILPLVSILRMFLYSEKTIVWEPWNSNEYGPIGEVLGRKYGYFTMANNQPNFNFLLDNKEDLDKVQLIISIPPRSKELEYINRCNQLGKQWVVWLPMSVFIELSKQIDPLILAIGILSPSVGEDACWCFSKNGKFGNRNSREFFSFFMDTSPIEQPPAAKPAATPATKAAAVAATPATKPAAKAAAVAATPDDDLPDYVDDDDV